MIFYSGGFDFDENSDFDFDKSRGEKDSLIFVRRQRQGHDGAKRNVRRQPGTVDGKLPVKHPADPACRSRRIDTDHCRGQRTGHRCGLRSCSCAISGSHRKKLPWEKPFSMSAFCRATAVVGGRRTGDRGQRTEGSVLRPPTTDHRPPTTDNRLPTRLPVPQAVRCDDLLADVG